MSESSTSTDAYIEITADIVSAFVSNNSLPVAELAGLIAAVHSKLRDLDGQSGAPAPAPAEPLTPAVPIKKSITPDFIVCLEDGKKFKSLKRHLGSQYGMTPDQYRAKWGLPHDYPMVAPAYAAMRSNLAKSIGLGRGAAAKPEARKTRGGRKKSETA